MPVLLFFKMFTEKARSYCEKKNLRKLFYYGIHKLMSCWALKQVQIESKPPNSWFILLDFEKKFRGGFFP